MKILVTGSSGLVGKNLVSSLKKKNYQVVEFDRTLNDNILSKNYSKFFGIDIVIHLAGIINNSDEELWKINVDGTKNVLEASINSRVKKFVFLSSTGVYGITNNFVDENTDVSPETIYEKSKYEGEQIVLNRQEEIHVNIIRSAMIFGNNDYWRKMISFLEKNYPLPCSGKNVFQIIYVKELVNAIITVIENGEPSEIYLVAGEEKMSLNEFCEKIKKELKQKTKLLHVPTTLAVLLGKIFKIKILNHDNIRHLSKQRNYDLTKIKSINFKQKYSLDKAIQQTIKEIQTNDS